MKQSRNHKMWNKRRRQLRRERQRRLPQLEQLERRELLTVTIDNMHLVSDTGYSSTDRVTSNPSVAATINGMFSGSYMNVQFDHRADGSIQGTAYANMPGQQITYDPRVYESSLSTYTGPFTLRYRSIEYNSQGAVVATGAWVDYTMTLEQSSSPEIDVVDPWSASIVDGAGSVNYGSTNAGTPKPLTFTIYNWGTSPLSIYTSSFSVPTGFSLISAPSSYVSPSGGSTTFTLQLNASTAGTYSGSVSFSNNDQNENPYNFTVTGTVQAQAPEIEMLINGTTVVPDGTGSVDLGNTTVGQPKPQSFTIKNWGSGSLTVNTSSISVPSGYSVVALPATTVNGGGGETTLVIRLDATAAGTYSGTVSVPNNDANENPYNFTVTGTVLAGGEQIQMANFGLVTDSGYYDTDRVTFDPRVSGKVNGDFDGGSVRVDFDHNGNGTAEGQVTVHESGDTFEYDPRDADSTLANFTGTLPLRYRLVPLDSSGNVVSTGGWTSYSYTLEAKPNASGAILDTFGLYRDTGTSSVDHLTVQPLLEAVVKGSLGTGTARIEFDHDNNGSVDGFVAATQVGVPLIYDPRDVNPALEDFIGQVNLRYRISKYDAGGVWVASSSWSPFRFTLEAPPQSNWTIQDLDLVRDTGTSDTDHLTCDGTLTGTVVGDGDYSHITVEFDLDGDADADDWTLTGDGMAFEYLPDYTQYGETTIYARALEWSLDYGAYLRTAWVPVEVTLYPPAAPDILEVALVQDTGESATDGITNDPRVRGQLTLEDGISAENVRIEMDVNNDGVVDGSTWTAADGSFQYRPTGVAVGSVTVAARSTRWDYVTDAEIAGTWKPYTFTYEPLTPPAVSVLALSHDTGNSATDRITTDPTVTGSLAMSLGSVTADSVRTYLVEFDHNGDGQVDGQTQTDLVGKFSYRPVNLPTGSVTLRARSTQWDENLNDYSASDWVALAFTLEVPAAQSTVMASLGLWEDTGSSASDLVTTNPAIHGAITQGGVPASHQVIEFDHNGDGVADGTSYADALGEFTYIPVGLSFGSHTLRARTRQWDYHLQQGSYTSWSALTFTLTAHQNLAPTIDQFGLRSDTGASQSDGLTANTSVWGRVSDDVRAAELTVEFDHNNNGTVDGWAFTDSDGYFYYEPAAIPLGSVSLKARPVEWDFSTGQKIYGAWHTLSFTYQTQSNAAPVLSDIGLDNDTGSSATDKITSDATLVGRIVNEGNLAAITVECDYNADGVVDQSITTDRTGAFRLEPTGLSHGNVTVRLRARELNEVAGQYLVSAWTPFTFTWEAASNTAAQVTSLSLQSDTGASSSDSISSDPTIVGQISNDGEVGGLLVELDHNGDGVVDGTAVTDADGSFTYLPEGIALGAVTISVRARESVENALPLFSAWTSIAYTYQEDPDTSVRVLSLSLMTDTGNSTTDGATSLGTVQGTVYGGAGITVEFDVNGDGLVDGEAVTNAAGQFEFTPEELEEGLVTVRARTQSDSLLESLLAVGNWTSVGYVYAANPDGTTAQTLVSAMSAYNTNWQAAQLGFETSIANSRQSYRSARQLAQNAFDNAMALAGGVYGTASQDAGTTYRQALAQAEAAYVAAMQAANVDLQANLAAFVGNKTSYALEDFQWPDPPPSGALQIPADSTQPIAPGQHLSAYDTVNQSPYALDQDLVYQTQVATAQAQYQQAVRAAQDAYTTGQRVAQATLDAATATYYAAYNATVVSETRRIEQAPPSTVPPVDLAYESRVLAEAQQNAENQYRDALQQHQRTYQETVTGFYPALMAALAQAQADYEARCQAASTELSHHSPYDPNYATYVQQFQQAIAAAKVLQATEQADAYEDYNDSNAALSRSRTEDDALALKSRNESIQAAQRIFDDRLATYNKWVEEEKLADVLELATATALAEETRARSQATAQHTYENAVATAAQTRANALTLAEQNHEQSLVQAKADAVTAWSTFVSTPWSIYQALLAALDAQYLASARTALLEHAADVAGETLELDQALATATMSRDQNAATRRRQESVDVATEQHAFGLQQAEFLRVRTVAGNTLWQTVNNDFTLADYEFSLDVAAAQEHYSQLAADAAYAQRVAIGNADAYLSGDQTAYNQAVQTAATAYQRALWDAQAIQTHETVDAKDARGEAKNLANKTYAVASHAADRVRVESVANASIGHETELAEIGTGCATTLQSLWGTWANATAQADYGFTSDVATLDKDLTITLQGFETVRSIGRSDAYYSMGETVAGNRAAAVSTWATQLATPWADYQEEVVQTQAEYATGLRGLMLAYATDVAAYVLSWVTGEAGASVTLAVAEALAAWTETSSVVTALNTYAAGAATVNVSSAVQIATASATQDKDKAEIDQTLQDALATEEQLLNNRLDQATWDYEDIQADTNRDVLKGVITSSQSVAQMTAAEEARLQTIASANVDRANHVAQANRTWTSDSGTVRVVFATSAGAVVSSTASSLKALSDTYATNESAAAATRVESEASAAGTHFVSNVGLQAGLDNQVAGEDRDLTIGVAELEGDKSQDEVAARGVYENTLYAHHATTRQLAAQQSNSLLDLYQAAYAAADALWSVQNRDALEAFEEDVRDYKVSAVTGYATAGYTETTQTSSAAISVAPQAASAEVGLHVDAGNAFQDLGVNVHVAYSKAIVAVIDAKVGFSIEFAADEKAYNDLLADAYVTWIAAAANAEAVYFLSDHTPSDVNARTVAIQTASDARAAAEKAAYVDNIFDVGNAHIAYRQSVGTAAVTLTTDGGDADAVFAGQQNTAATNFATASGTATNQWVGFVTQAEAGSATTVATVTHSLTANLAGAGNQLQTASGTAYVTRATGRATAEAQYQVPHAAQKAATLASFATANNTPDNQYQAQAAAAFAEWISQVDQYFRSCVTGFAQAEANQAAQKKAADFAYRTASAEYLATFVPSVGGVERTLAIQDTGAWTGYFGDSVTHENGLSSGLTGADRQLAIDLAMADAQLLVDVMIAQRDFQVAEALDDPDADVDKRVAVADAEYDRRVSRADAELAWRQTALPVIGGYAASEAESRQGLVTNVAANEVDYANGYADGMVTLLDADALAVASFSAGDRQATSVFRSATATVQADYWSAQQDADTVALQHFATNMAIPWAQFKADLAVVRHDWWETQREAYLAWCASIAAAEAAFQTLVGAAWSARSSTMGAADTVYVSTLAYADETQFVSTSQADEVYVESMAGAYQTYQASLALADRDFTVNVAAAQRNFDINGNQAVFASAVAAATATHAEACRAAGEAYGRTRVAADDQRRVAQAQAQFVYAQAAGPANVSWVESYAAAKLTYVTAQGTAHVASVTDVANDRTAYRTQEATSLASAMVVFATAHPSPWATYTRDTIDAWRDQIVATAPAEATYEIALATSQAASEIAQTVAQNTFDIAVAQAGAQEWLAAAQAGLDQANGERQADVAFAAATGQAAPQGDPTKRPPSPPPPPLKPGVPVPAPANAATETYGTGQDQSGTAGSTASVSMEAPDPNAVEPPGKLSIARDPIMGTGRFRETQHSDGTPPVGSDAAISADFARHGELRGIQNHGAKQTVPGIGRALNTTGDLCLSAVTGPYRDIAEIVTGKDMWDQRELTRTEIGVRVGLTFGVPIAGIFLAKAFSVGSKVARAVHRAEQAGETVEEVLESGVRIADRAENVAGTAKDAIQPGMRAASDVDPKGVAGLVDNVLPVINKTCFVAGTPLLTPEGAKAIEDFKAGDYILSRPEDQPNGAVRTSVVEEVFELSASILQLRLGGRTIETTAEHPFYVANRGWIRAENLESGDLLVGHDDRLTSVDSITPTDRHETVYNVRVAEDHTYFVGDEDWEFSVWVHNAYSVRQAADGTWEVLDGAGVVVRSGLSDNVANGLARLFNNLPDINKAVNTKIQHAADRAVSRLGMNRDDALAALRALSEDVGRNRIPPGAIPDLGFVIPRTDSLLVPFNGGAAVYEIAKNGTAKLTTVLDAQQFLDAMRKLGL